MRQHIDAIRALLSPTPVYYADATGATTYPDVLVWSTPGGDDVESPIGDDGAWSDLIGVTSVDITLNNALLLAAKVRLLLDSSTPAVAGRYVRLHLRRDLGQTVHPDRDVTLPGTNTHPCFQVDRYLMTSQPIQE